MAPGRHSLAHHVPWSRLVRLAIGTLAIGVGITLLLRSRLGLLPLDVLHLGVAQRFGFSVGGGIIATQALMLMAFVPLKIRPGIGTIAGFLVPALVTDALLGWIPVVDSVPVRILLLAAGAACFCVGVAVYLTAALGPLPRDGLMLALARGRPRRVAGVRIGLDAAFLLLGGLLLGPSFAWHSGTVGVGTLALALTCGPVIAWLLGRFRHRCPLQPSSIPDTSMGATTSTGPGQHPVLNATNGASHDNPA
ncbi:YczE/YyaS/YitT family protein [Amycolatopsis anabasis]|uniref:YczE/YyaS/YitT family protein n=1 Tax=Amycolatopsis anabasis TaxID=1840409 RepID=UPI00131DCBF5|nr:hypothetical protein [Amycolatopsis anabasis]